MLTSGLSFYASVNHRKPLGPIRIRFAYDPGVPGQVRFGITLLKPVAHGD